MKNLLGCVLALTSCTTLANWGVTGDITNMRIEKQNAQIVTAGVSFDIPTDFQSIKIVPILRFGTGINSFGYTETEDGKPVLAKDGKPVRHNISVDYFAALSIRSTYQATEAFSIFVQPTYARTIGDVKQVGTKNKASYQANDNGFGIGFGYKVDQHSNIEISYEDFDEMSLVNLSYRYTF
ncbi:hypothetical protein [Pseudoalteromonas xiamenensis]|uniref:Outer membrane protein beta-barrel domain-containing protein n=1 Tax=Pseudoalteromonas xiamenensis TaxID=882626 RepID=A0A975HLM1_9GAMM|nr:hypothetical protein [Pseudoalteromonas xiamenensis]QTH72236.1 hypothetical protein J5O05_04995 [Pseudoalteromonas xiamenensis]